MLLSVLDGSKVDEGRDIPAVRPPIMKMKMVKRMVLVAAIDLRPTISSSEVPKRQITKHHALRIMFCPKISSPSNSKQERKGGEMNSRFPAA